MKKLKFLFTALFLLCNTIVFAHDFEVGGIYYKVISLTDKTVVVTYAGDYYYHHSNEYGGNVTIPSSVTYDGITYSVTGIESYAFYNCLLNCL